MRYVEGFMTRIFARLGFGAIGAIGAPALLLVCCSSFASDDEGQAPDAASATDGSIEASPADAAGGADVEEPADAGACPKGFTRRIEDDFASLGGVWSKQVSDGGSVDVAEPYVPRSGAALVASLMVPDGGSARARAYREEPLEPARRIRSRFLLLLEDNRFFAQIGCALLLRATSAPGYTVNRFELVRRPNGSLALRADRFVNDNYEIGASLTIPLSVVDPPRWYEVELDVAMTEESARASVTVTDTTSGSPVPGGATTEDVPLVGPIDRLELHCGAHASGSSGEFRIAIDDLTVDVCPR
jgi:hypothetical protein